MTRHAVIPVLGLLIGVAVGFSLAYLIWTLDGQPSGADVWSGVAAILFCGSAWGGMFAGLHIGERNS